FYDGACLICQKEIRHYQKLQSLKPIHWLDISEPCPMLEAYGIDTEEAMKRFHVINDLGQVTKGAEAFLTLWRELPGYRHLAKAVTTLHLQGIIEWGYRRFAKRRYRQACLRADNRCHKGEGR
ncbi:MAG: DUF393 domain-containing protein, partial [Gammaproteobacteria bacterium]